MDVIVGAPPLLEAAYAEEPLGDEEVEALLDDFGVEALDEDTFVVHLNRPATYFLSIATLWVTAPIRESFEFSEAAAYISSGPMMLVEWDHNGHIALEPNPIGTARRRPSTVSKCLLWMSQQPSWRPTRATSWTWPP
jgi:ABC-type transport system substrate-binding protein